MVNGLLLSLAAASAATNASSTVQQRWNPKGPDNSQVLPAFSYATVEPVLTAIGARFQRSGRPGAPTLMVTFANGRKAVLSFGSCDAAATACKALSVQSYWTKIANAPPERANAAIDGFNQRYSFAKAFIAADGRPALQRYLTADYGFLRGNLAVNLLVFASQAERFATEILQPLESGKR